MKYFNKKEDKKGVEFMLIYEFNCEDLGSRHRLQFGSDEESREIKKFLEEIHLKCGDVYSLKRDNGDISDFDITDFKEYLKGELATLECIMKIKSCKRLFADCIKKTGDVIFRLIGESIGQYDSKSRLYYILHIIFVLRLISVKMSPVIKEALGIALSKQIFFAYKN